jgi:hypothetical protein
MERRTTRARSAIAAILLAITTAVAVMACGSGSNSSGGPYASFDNGGGLETDMGPEATGS